MASRAKVTPEDVAAAVKAQPLVGVSRAAKILGIVPPNFRRYRDRLTEIPVEGSASVFIRSEVEALAKELKG
jgi:hypothetical protein